MASLRVTRHPGMAPGQKLPFDSGCLVVEQAGGQMIELPPARVPLDADEFVIGRESDCHLTVPSQAVSRRHARLRFENGQWSVEDLKTRNGTWLNDQPVSIRTPLGHGDRLRVPGFEAVFENA